MRYYCRRVEVRQSWCDVDSGGVDAGREVFVLWLLRVPDAIGPLREVFFDPKPRVQFLENRIGAAPRAVMVSTRSTSPVSCGQSSLDGSDACGATDVTQPDSP